MNSLKRSILEWFGYSRRERRATMILVIIIAIVILARYFIPEKGIDIDIKSFMPSSTTEEEITAGTSVIENVSLFYFDPNNASFSDLTSLGIPGKVANTLIRYRSSGAVFREPEDIMKVYGLDSLLAKTLIPYIIIKGTDTIQSNNNVMQVPVSVKESPAGVTVDINRCDSAALEALPGIGPVLSARIIKYRELLGGFVDSDQLKEVYGLTDSVHQVISKMITIDSSAMKKININSAGFRELERHPYIERYEAQAIIKYRDLAGRIDNISRLVSEKILTGDKARKLLPYLIFE